MFENSEQTAGLYAVVLAIDFGTQRIGLAISRGTLAEPLRIIENPTHSAHDPKVVAEIKKVLEEENVSKIIVGISENEMAVKTRQFVMELEKEISLPIEFTDETLSSKSVHEKLRHASQTKRRQPIDHYAAAEFLQEWLDAE